MNPPRAAALDQSSKAGPGAVSTAGASGLAALVAVQLLFGFFPLFVKYAYDGFTPWALGAWRMLAGGAILAAVAFAVHGRRAVPMRADWPRLILCSLLGVVINILLFLKGMELSTSIYAGLTLPLIPVYTFVLAVCLGQERFDLVRGVGIALAAVGAALLAFSRQPAVASALGPHSKQGLGLALFFLNTFSYALYLVLVRPLFARYPALVVAAWVFLLSIPCVPLFAWGEDLFPTGASTRSIGGLVYSVLGATVLSYLLNAYALSKVCASTTASFIFFQPAIVVLAGVWLLGEKLAGHTALAGAFTLVGVWLVVKRRSTPHESVRLAP